jgi:hypothetical protein
MNSESMDLRPGLLAAALGMAGIAASALAAPEAPDRPSRQQEAVDQFISACFDGALHTRLPHSEIARAALPSSVRSHYRASFSGRHYRLGTLHPSYLLLLTNEDPGATFASVCALAVPGNNLLPVFRGLTQRLGMRWGIPPGETLSASIDDVEDGYVISGALVGGYVLLEVSHYADRVRDSKAEAR